MEEPEVPLASGTHWALLNLLLMILTVIGGVAATAGAARKKEEQNSRMLYLLGIVPAVVSAVVFFLTERIGSPMVFVDKMTVIMTCITVVEAAVMVLAYRNKALARDDER